MRVKKGWMWLSLSTLALFTVPLLALQTKHLCCMRQKYTLKVAQIFDDVIDTPSLRIVDLHARAGHLGHTIMTRGSCHARTAVEAAIELCLHHLQDSSPFVEYWWREEWIDLEAHRDVDEVLAREEPGNFRFPSHGHVLYLDVGQLICGPTVLLSDSIDGEYDSLTIVHAKTGRLLRFAGDMTHAVPRPALAFFDPEVGGSNTELYSRIRRDVVPAEERRSVLLFNTWSTPPRGIDSFPQKGSLDLSKSIAWSISGGSWIPRSIANSSQETANNLDFTRMKVGLLGDKLRRGRSERYLDLRVSLAALSAMGDPKSLPETFYLQQKDEMPV